MEIDYKNYVGYSDTNCDKSVLKDPRGVMRTRSLFRETFDYKTAKQVLEPIYTLFDDTKNGLPSVWRIYMEAPTEYDAAMRIVGGMRHWEALCKTRWFTAPLLKDVNYNHITGLYKWREFKEQKDDAAVRAILLELAKSGNVSAAKALLAPKPERKVKEAAEEKKTAEENNPITNSEDADIKADAKLLKLVAT